MTRDGVLFRSDALVKIGSEGRTALDALGIRTAIDLREPLERELDPADISGALAELVEWPLIDGRIDLQSRIGLAALYQELVERCGERIAGAADLLARADALPAVLFCSAGKDRTGLLTALILSAVGVGDEAIIADYIRSGAAIRGEFRDEIAARSRAAGLSEQSFAIKSGAPAELIRDTLSTVRDRHGGAATYLVTGGLSAQALEALRHALICTR